RLLPGMVYRCRHDRHRSLIYASPRAAELTGYDVDELAVGGRLSFASLIHVEDRERVLAELDTAVVCRQPYRVSYRIVCADGVQKWVWDQGAAIDDESGDVIALEGYLSHSEQASHADAALQASEARLRCILNATPESVHIASLDGHLLDINPAGLRLCGASDMAEVYEKCVFDYVDDEYRDAYRMLHESAARNISGVLEFRARGLDGRRQWLECHMAPLHDQTSHVSSVLGLTRDITHIKRAA